VVPLLIPLLLIVVAFAALRRGRVHYDAGMTADALWFVGIFLLASTMAGFYLLGYQVALWHS